MPSYSGDGANHFGILEECRKIDRELDQLDGQLNELNSVFGQTLARPDMPSGEINNLSSQIITRYITLVSGVKNIKLQPESGNERNASQVGNVDRRLRRTYHRYQVLEADFRRESKEASKHQFRITHPDATDAEVEDAVADTDTPVFQQVLPSSDRRHEASTQFSNVKKRHHSIHDIERQLIELAQLFQELDVIVQQHAPLIVNIEHRSEDVSDEVTKGNGEIDAAIKSARTHNQKKWWCFLIVALTVMVVIAVVVTLVMKKTVHA